MRQEERIRASIAPEPPERKERTKKLGMIPKRIRKGKRQGSLQICQKKPEPKSQAKEAIIAQRRRVKPQHGRKVDKNKTRKSTLCVACSCVSLSWMNSEKIITWRTAFRRLFFTQFVGRFVARCVMSGPYKPSNRDRNLKGQATNRGNFPPVTQNSSQNNPEPDKQTIQQPLTVYVGDVYLKIRGGGAHGPPRVSGESCRGPEHRASQSSPRSGNRPEHASTC